MKFYFKDKRQGLIKVSAYRSGKDIMSEETDSTDTVKMLLSHADFELRYKQPFIISYEDEIQNVPRPFTSTITVSYDRDGQVKLFDNNSGYIVTLPDVSTAAEIGYAIFELLIKTEYKL